MGVGIGSLTNARRSEPLNIKTGLVQQDPCSKWLWPACAVFQVACLADSSIMCVSTSYTRLAIKVKVPMHTCRGLTGGYATAVLSLGFTSFKAHVALRSQPVHPPQHLFKGLRRETRTTLRTRKCHPHINAGGVESLTLF